ncbi:VP2 structural protein [bat polyomavirus 3b]|uniref:Minor capsid protein VP2 n=1 Tax=bat polyomavirus 3b TaxID=2758136 RepID=J3TP01_9POLY|nr:VP2 structural protein [bat polyomavirus 3b]AFP94209.1 VP2 structural protein [bat polyomavirus 3b]
MGGVLSTIVDLIVVAIDLSFATGLSMEAILTGEALAAIEAEVSAPMTLEGLSGIEALTSWGWTAEQFSNLSLLASTYSQAIGYGVLFQTVSGLSTMIQVAVRLGLEVADTNRNVTEEQLRAVFGELVRILHVNLSHQFNPLDWCGSLHENWPKDLTRIDIPLLSKFGDIIEVSRWVRQASFTTDPDFESGDIIAIPFPPGGAQQRVTPDWLLHLILRLHGAQEKAPLC